MSAPDLSVVVPVYRNETTIEPLMERIRAALEGAGKFEVLFVDDAGPDRSLDVLGALAGQDARVGVISLARNLGQNRAVLVGLAHARGRRVVVLDADLQDPPEAIPGLLSALQGDVAAVFAGRRGRYESPLRLATSYGLKRLLSLVSKRRLPPDAGLFVAMDRAMVERLLDCQDADPHVPALMGRTGLRLISVPVERAGAPNGRSGYTARGRLRLAARAIATALGPRDGPPGGRPWRDAQAWVRAYAGVPFEGSTVRRGAP